MDRSKLQVLRYGTLAARCRLPPPRRLVAVLLLGNITYNFNYVSTNYVFCGAVDEFVNINKEMCGLCHEEVITARRGGLFGAANVLAFQE